MERDPRDTPGGDVQWPPADSPAGGPRDGEQPDATDDMPIGGRLERDPGNIGSDVPESGDVTFPSPEPSTPHM